MGPFKNALNIARDIENPIFQIEALYELTRLYESEGKEDKKLEYYEDMKELASESGYQLLINKTEEYMD